MSKSRHNKNVIEDYEEEYRYRQKQDKQKRDKHKERRIERALKTKNVYEYMRYHEDVVGREGPEPEEEI